MLKLKKFNDKEKFYLKFLILISLWILIFSYLIYFGYLFRVNNAFKFVKEKMETSVVLSSKIGKIKKIEYNNFPSWTSRINNEKCVKYKVKTIDNKNHNVCAILYLQRIDGYSTIGYYIDGTRVLDFPKFNINDYEKELRNNKYDGEKLIFKDYYELYIELNKLHLFDVLDSNTNIYELSFDSVNNIWKCRIKTYKDSNIIKSHILLINSNGNILAFWEDNDLEESNI